MESCIQKHVFNKSFWNNWGAIQKKVNSTCFSCIVTWQHQDGIKYLKIFNVYLFLREREKERAWVGEKQRGEGDTESEAVSRLWVVSTEPGVGLKLTNHEIVTWAEVGCLTYWATQVPQDGIKFKIKNKSALNALEKTVGNYLIAPE